MDVPCCQAFRTRQEALRNAAAAVGWGGRFRVASSPFCRRYFHALNLSRLQALFSALVPAPESVDAAFRTGGRQNCGFCLLKKKRKKENKATGYISVYYNVAGQDKANYTSPTRHHGEIHCAILIVFLHCGE